MFSPAALTALSSCRSYVLFSSSFFFISPATTYISTLSLHDALPIWHGHRPRGRDGDHAADFKLAVRAFAERPCDDCGGRSEEHTSELQSLRHLVCRLLLEKKKHILSSRDEVGQYARRDNDDTDARH